MGFQGTSVWRSLRDQSGLYEVRHDVEFGRDWRIEVIIKTCGNIEREYAATEEYIDNGSTSGKLERYRLLFVLETSLCP